MTLNLGFVGVFLVASLLSLAADGPLAHVFPDFPLQNRRETPPSFAHLAQSLTERCLPHHLDTLVVGFHAQIPGKAINRVVSINRAQLTHFLLRPSSGIDTNTVKTQKIVIQVIPAAHRMEVHPNIGETIATIACDGVSKMRKRPSS